MTSESIDPNESEAALQRQIAALTRKLKAAQRAKLSGSGALAQDGGEALGERSVKVVGSNAGVIITGTQIVSNYIASSNTALSKGQIAQQVAGIWPGFGSAPKTSNCAVSSAPAARRSCCCHWNPPMCRCVRGRCG